MVDKESENLMGNYRYEVQYSPNYSSRAYYGYDSSPSGITIHWWGAYGQHHANVADYLCRPGGNTSAHEVISGGWVTHLVDFDQAAWHAGSTEGNGDTIGLECRPEMSAEDMETVAQRCADIEDQLGKSMHYYGHKDWYPTSCPGTWYDKITWIVNRVNEIHAGVPSSTPVPSGWPLSGSEYFGPKDGPANCIGGFYAEHRPDIQRIQQRFQELGHAPSYPAWADGIWEPPTTEACQEWERATGRTVDGIITEDDWYALFEEDDMPSAEEIWNYPVTGGPDGTTVKAKDRLAWIDSIVNQLQDQVNAISGDNGTDRYVAPYAPNDEENPTRWAGTMWQSTWNSAYQTEQLARQILAAVAEQSGVSAADIAAALAPQLSEQLLPLISEAVGTVLGQDNEEQAQAIVDALAQRLAGGAA